MAIRIGSNERDGTFYTQGLALKTVLDRIDTLAPVQVPESAQASIDNANRLAPGWSRMPSGPLTAYFAGFPLGQYCSTSFSTSIGTFTSCPPGPG